MSEPLVKMLCHTGPVKDLVIDRLGQTMVTTGLDAIIRVYDIRMFKELQAYTTPAKDAIKSMDISQRNVLALGFGSNVQMWRDYVTTKPSSPYMCHQLKERSNVLSLKFCPFEDVLGIGHSTGFSSIAVPGSGEPNFDTYSANVFQQKNQERKQLYKICYRKYQLT